MRIRRIDLYIFKEVLNPFLAGTVFFAFVFLLFQMLRLAEELIVNNAPFNLILKLLGILVINFLPLGLPIAFLMAVLFAFSRFSNDSEVVAMKASGMGLCRISAPVFALSFGVAAISLFLNLNWAPWSEVASRNTLIKIGNSKFASAINEGTFTTGFFNLLLFTEKVNKRAGRMENVFMFDERDPKHPLTIVAKNGELIRVQSGDDDLGGLVLQLQDGSIHQNEMKDLSYNRINFDTYQLFFDIPDTQGKFGYRPKMMESDELFKKMQDPNRPEREHRELKTEYWRRLTVALVPILFVLMGMGFGTVRTRGARAGVMLVAFITMGIYWQVQVSAIWLGEAGTLPPWLAMQIPNILIGVAGIWSFKRASW
jgi:lipopolysaccharide export system permease protein